MTCKRLLAILPLFVAAVFTVVDAQCPDPNRIIPCYCNLDGGEAVVTCSNIQNVRDLNKLASNSEGYPYKEVRIEGSTLPSIPVVIPEQVEMDSFTLRDLKLNALFDGVPRTLPKLKELHLQNVELQEGMQWRYFEHTKDLETLEIDHVNIPKITTDFNKFVAPSLIKVSFIETQTNEIELDAMKDLRNLDSITVAHNKLQHVYRGNMPKPFNGQYLNFQNNNIAEIKEDVFSDMAKLKIVLFDHNKITVIARPSESGVLERIEKFDLSRNPIDCSCKLKWMPEVTWKSLEGQCESPQKLRGKRLNSLTADDFSNC